MKIPTNEIPQADSLEVVEKAVRAVTQGAKTYQQIAAALGYTLRQGRYYRLAGQILGFLARTGPNVSKITSTGRAYLEAKGISKKQILTRAILEAPVFQRVIPFLESRLPKGATRTDLESFISSVTKTTSKMARRRTFTMISWLQTIDMIDISRKRYVLKSLPKSIPFIQYVYDEEPLLPTKFELREYKWAASRFSAAKRFISYEIRKTQRDRANSVHSHLTNLVATKIRKAGGIPRSNRLIDLAANIKQNTFLFEMKSTTQQNLNTQVRKGVSQLYEYRYLQGIRNAKLVLVIENPLTRPLEWMADYLIKDRRIFLVWDGDNDKLYFPNAVKNKLSFLL